MNQPAFEKYLAAKLAGWETIPAMVKPMDVSIIAQR